MIKKGCLIKRQLFFCATGRCRYTAGFAEEFRQARDPLNEMKGGAPLFYEFHKSFCGVGNVVVVCQTDCSCV